MLQELWLLREFIRSNNYDVDTGEKEAAEAAARLAAERERKATHYWSRNTESLQSTTQ